MGGVRDGYSGFKFYDAIQPQTTNATQLTGSPIDKRGYETVTFLHAIMFDVSGQVSTAQPGSAYSGYYLRMQHGISNAAGTVVWSNCQASHMLCDVTMSGQMSDISDTSYPWMRGNQYGSICGSGLNEGCCFHYGLSQATNTLLSYIESKVWAAGYVGNRRWARVLLSCSGGPAAAEISTVGFACFAVLGLEADWPINQVKRSGPPAGK